MLQYSHSSELFAVLFVYIDKEQLDKLEFDKDLLSFVKSKIQEF